MDAKDWDSSYSKGRTPWRESEDLSGRLKIAGITSGNAMDLGCGTGEKAIWLAEHSFEVEGLDYSNEALKIAREHSAKVSWIEWDLEQLANYPFKHPKYDLIIDNKVLAFIKNKEAYLETIQKVLGGVYILTVFHEHDEKPAICVPKSEFDRLTAGFEVISKEIRNHRPGKVSGVYFLRNK